MEALASPYKDEVFRNLHLLWDKKGRVIRDKGLTSPEDDIEMKIITLEQSEQRNIEKLKLKEVLSKSSKNFYDKYFTKIKTA